MIYLWIGLALIAFGLWIVWLLNAATDDRFRLISNEIWGHYFVPIIRWGWPWFLIIAIYRLIDNGTLAAFIRTASTH